MIANNIISEFGQGHAAWVWGDNGTPIRFDDRQEPDDPPLQDVMVTGNVVYNSRRDEAGDEAARKPTYRFAVRMAGTAKNVRFSGNIFHPGYEGISREPLPQAEP